MPRYGSYERDRDERGRFISVDDERVGRRYASRGEGRRCYDDDDDGRGHRRGGWFGDREGQAGAARQHWDEDNRGYRSRGGRYDDDDDDDRGHGGWFGDPEGHAAAARHGLRMRSRYDDDRRGGSRSRGSDHGGWFGDARGHAEASRRGRQHRR